MEAVYKPSVVVLSCYMPEFNDEAQKHYKNSKIDRKGCFRIFINDKFYYNIITHNLNVGTVVIKYK